MDNLDNTERSARAAALDDAKRMEDAANAGADLRRVADAPDGAPERSDPIARGLDAVERAEDVVKTLAPPETPEQAFARKLQEAPRSMVDVTRMEVCTGMIWLADGSRIAFKFGVPPVLARVDGVVDPNNGLPIYEIPWQAQVVTKPRKT